MSLFLRIVFSLIAFAVPVYGTLAAEKKIDSHVATAVADHRAMAEAHLNAAKCLESGKAEKDCHAQLTKDCKGLAIGKFCGMAHKH